MVVMLSCRKKVLDQNPNLSGWSVHVLPVHAWALSGYSCFLPQSRPIVLKYECVFKILCVSVSLFPPKELSFLNRFSSCTFELWRFVEHRHTFPSVLGTKQESSTMELAELHSMFLLMQRESIHKLRTTLVEKGSAWIHRYRQ
ncbi:hypothetical protein GOODEAATRI_011558 [Goodea atripinnis]|uniref:Uncharacterized protein n=1 Tax=Goodea atripinnis TaxID=208336 RepID=A0ABV0PXN2_9TELE